MSTSRNTTGSQWPAVIRSVVIAGMVTGLAISGKIGGELALAALTAIAGIPWLSRLKK